MAEENETKANETSSPEEMQHQKKPFFKKLLGFFAGVFTLGIYNLVKRRLDKQKAQDKINYSMDEIYGDFDPDAETTVEKVSSDEIASEKGTEEKGSETESHENSSHESTNSSEKSDESEERERE